MQELLIVVGIVLSIVALNGNRALRRRLEDFERELAQWRTGTPAPRAEPRPTVPMAEPRPAPPSEPTPAPATRAVYTARAPTPPPEATAPPRAPAKPVFEQAPPGPDYAARVVEAVKRWFTVGNVPVKVGMLVLFAGVAALLKYASDQGWLRAPVELRLAGVAAAALGALVFAWRKREDNRVFALSLQGGAIGILLMTVFAAFKLYGLVPAGVAFAVSIVLVAGAAALAVLQDAKALAFLAALAGFLAPIWLSTGSGNHVALFSYYAVLNAGIFAIAWWKHWRALNLLGFIATFGIGTFWGVLDYQPAKFATTEPFLLLFFAFYLLIPLFHALRQPLERRDFIDGTLVFATPLVAFALQAGLLRGDRMPLAFNALGLAVLYAGLAWWMLRRDGLRVLGEAYALLAAGFATLSVPLALSARATASVFALEGAGLVWLGLRQQRRIAEWSGIALQGIAAAIWLETLSGGWARGDTALANAPFMSALIIALAALATAWRYRDKVPAGLFYLWGLAWWVCNGIAEIFEFLPSDPAVDTLLVFVAATGWLAAEVHRRRPEGLLAWTTLVALAAGVPIAVLQAWEHHHPFDEWGAPAWAAFAVLGVRSLMCLRGAPHRVAARAQFVWWLVWPFVLSLVFAWVAGHFELAEGWRVAATALPWLAVAAACLYRWAWLAAPLQAAFDAKRVGFEATVFAIVGLGWAWSLFVAGNSAPLPWVPVANPMELAQLAALALAYAWWSSPHAPAPLAARRIAIASVFGFAWLTSVVLHAVHHWGGIPWNDALIGTSLAQTSLTVAWSILGVLAWVLGSRRGQRTLWLVGAVLMAVVLAKLVLVDRTNLGNGLGIASFLAFGLLCTVVGYLAPAPPRASSSEATA